jgi:hypothetical protein
VIIAFAPKLAGLFGLSPLAASAPSTSLDPRRGAASVAIEYARRRAAVPATPLPALRGVHGLVLLPRPAGGDRGARLPRPLNVVAGLLIFDYAVKASHWSAARARRR